MALKTRQILLQFNEVLNLKPPNLLGNSGYNNDTTLGSAKEWYKHYKFAITVTGPHNKCFFLQAIALLY